jgi:hypothetical protein
MYPVIRPQTALRYSQIQIPYSHVYVLSIDPSWRTVRNCRHIPFWVFPQQCLFLAQTNSGPLDATFGIGGIVQWLI